MIGMRAILATLAAAALAACTSSPVPAVDVQPSAVSHEGHDPALEASKVELIALGLNFEPAGPHHVLGTAPNGVEVDLVGIPLEEAVLSIPADQPDAVRASMEPYLAPIERTLAAPAALDGWLGEELAAWNGRSELSSNGTFGPVHARLRSTADPAYVVLTLTGA